MDGGPWQSLPPALDAEAEYQDGRQARPLWLRARLTPESLELRRAGGQPVAEWPVSALREVDRAGGALRLAVDGSDARLLVSDPRFAEALGAALRPRRRAAMMRRFRLAAAAAVAVPLVASGLWLGWPPAADAIARAVPAGWERSIGAATAAALVGSNRVCDAPEGQAALDGLAARLAAAGGVSGPLRVRVVDDGTVNAFAAPGGEVVVFRGLLARAASAEELAGVLAHELGHVRHRHGLRNAVRVAGLFMLTGALTGGSDAAALAALLVGLSYSRDFERQADADGARMLAASGIGAEGLAAFFARMERDRGESSGSLWGYVSTHPADADRVAALRAAERPAAPTPALSPAEWAAVRGICGAAAAGRPRPGPVRPAPPADTAPGGGLGVSGAWEARVLEEFGMKVCYAFTGALASGRNRRGGQPQLWVTRLSRSHMGDVNLNETIELRGMIRAPSDAQVQLGFGAHRSTMTGQGGVSWRADTPALSAHLRAAEAEGVGEAVVGWAQQAEGAGGAQAHEHRFALAGFTEAHRAISGACPAAP